jgi:hypothetical protein
MPQELSACGILVIDAALKQRALMLLDLYIQTVYMKWDRNEV